MEKTYYARTNRYGSPTSAGFDNTMSVVRFASRAERDAYVAANADDNMAICAISAATARRIERAY